MLCIISYLLTSLSGSGFKVRVNSYQCFMTNNLNVFSPFSPPEILMVHLTAICYIKSGGNSKFINFVF